MKTKKVMHYQEIPSGFTGKVEWATHRDTNNIYCVDNLVNGKLHSLIEPARKYTKVSRTLYCINGQYYSNNEQEFYNSKEYRLAKQQEDLLENMKKIKSIK